MADRNDGIRAASRAGKQDKEEEEKMRMLTRRLWAWSERLEEGRSSRISAETVQDEEDDVFFSRQIMSILRAKMTLVARRSRCERGLSRESSGRRRHGEEEAVMLSVAREKKKRTGRRGEEESSGGSMRE
jgi:hypothetical protein